MVRQRRPVTRILLYLVLIVAVLFVLFPFFWMILTAIRPRGTEFNTLLPERLTLENFVQVWTRYNFARYFANSLVVATSVAFFSTLFAGMAGYVFAKKRFFLKEKLFWFILSTMMIPGMMYMVPQFAIVNQLGWMNTFKAMIIPHLANIFGVFLMRQYVQTIPTALIEAAHIDGASELQVFTRIIAPLSKAVLITLFLLSFLFHWSNFLWQLIVTTDAGMYTVPVGLAMFRGQHSTDWTLTMAASCFSIIPITILFIVAQRFFIEGLTSGAVKE
ncbi:carbohydrate ABC transporter permease [bacterium]|nr:carbohydrate ABC transporter permease [candidate division CSSED10-310 bacterium]